MLRFHSALAEMGLLPAPITVGGGKKTRNATLDRDGFEAWVSDCGNWLSPEEELILSQTEIAADLPEQRERYLVVVVPLDSATGLSKAQKSWAVAGSANRLYRIIPGPEHELSVRVGVWRTTRDALESRKRRRAALDEVKVKKQRMKAERKQRIEDRKMGRV